MTVPKPKSVTEYIAGFPPDVQSKLEQIRVTIRMAAPKAEEMISYNMPLYKWNGMLVSFAAWKNHIALYPTPVATGELKKKLISFEGAKSTLRFPIEKPIPLGLIVEVVKLRMKENLKKLKASPKKKR